MLIPEAVQRLQKKFESCQTILPTGTKMLYEFFVTPDEDATSDDGVFLLVAPRVDQDKHYDVLTELHVHYNLGQDEDYEIKKVREWLKNYQRGVRPRFSHYQFVVEISREGLPRFLPNGKIEQDSEIQFESGGNEKIFSEILSS